MQAFVQKFAVNSIKYYTLILSYLIQVISGNIKKSMQFVFVDC